MEIFHRYLNQFEIDHVGFKGQIITQGDIACNICFEYSTTPPIKLKQNIINSQLKLDQAFDIIIEDKTSNNDDDLFFYLSKCIES